MHELSIAVHIVATLESDLADKPGRILAVRLDVGVLSGVVADALQFSWDLACEGSRLAGSQLKIHELPAVVHCEKCAARRTLASSHRMRCPVCGEWTPDVVSGSELQIRAVEMAAESLARA